MSEDSFDPTIYPMGPMSRLTSSVPLMELLLESDGFKVRESLSPDVTYVYPTCPEGMSYQKQWSILYENILDWDLKDQKKLEAMVTLVIDPLMMAHYATQRLPDDELPNRACLATKYPV